MNSEVDSEVDLSGVSCDPLNLLYKKSILN